MKKIKVLPVRCPVHNALCKKTMWAWRWLCPMCENKHGYNVIATVKILGEGICNDCGIPLKLDKEGLAYQRKHMDNFSVRTACDECIGKGHTITDEELGQVKMVKTQKIN